MMIQHISLQNFGSVLSYDAELTSIIHIIDSRYTDELAAAISFLLCSKASSAIPEHWLQEGTRISAIIRMEETTYCVCAKPQLGQLQLFVTDPTGCDATAQYQYALFHCPEQDTMEIFDGLDETMPLRLY